MTWIRSSACETNSCVEVAFLDEGVMVQSSDGGSAVMFSYAEWAAFVPGVKAGEFDGPQRAAVNGEVTALP